MNERKEGSQETGRERRELREMGGGTIYRIKSRVFGSVFFSK